MINSYVEQIRFLESYPLVWPEGETSLPHLQKECLHSPTGCAGICYSVSRFSAKDIPFKLPAVFNRYSS